MLECVVHMLMVSESGVVLGIWMVQKVAYGTIVRRWLRIVLVCLMPLAWFWSTG